MLLIGAGLMLTSFSRLRSVDPGFRVTEVVTVELMLPLARFDETAQRNFYMSVLERLQANPVTATSAMLFPFPLWRWQRAGEPLGRGPAREAARTARER